MIIKWTPTKFKEAFRLDTVTSISAERRAGTHWNSAARGEGRSPTWNSWLTWNNPWLKQFDDSSLVFAARALHFYIRGCHFIASECLVFCFSSLES